MENVYIILLNWNGWQDTVQCIGSILNSTYKHFRIVVCDNDSSDDSLVHIKAWADGRLHPDNDQTGPVLALPDASWTKPLRYVEFNRKQAESAVPAEDVVSDDAMVLIQTGANLGFAGGNNVGIRYALNQRADYIWLLNNDTLIEPHTLKVLTDSMNEAPNTGLLGSVIYHASQPDHMQTYGGGRLTPLLGTDRFILSQGRVDYVSGTSLFIRRAVIEQIGLLDENFFFYWEDVDYSTRARQAGWNLGTADQATVYHKFSASVGSQSLRSDLFKVNALKTYFHKHQRFWWFPVTVNILGMLTKRFFRGQFERLSPIFMESVKPVSD